MTNTQTVKNITTPEDLEALTELCEESSEPVCFSVKGHKDIIAMSREMYEEIDLTLFRIKLLGEPLDEEKAMKAGDWVDGDTALSDLRKELGL